MRKSIVKLIALLLCITVVSGIISMPVKAETQKPVDIQVSVDGRDFITAHGLFVAYDNYLYVSLVDMQNLLKGSSCEFDFSIEDGTISIVTENITDMTVRDRALSGWTEEEKAGYENKSAGMNTMYVNGNEKRYATILTTLGGYKDCLIQIYDFSMILNVDVSGENTTININSNNNMKPVNPKELENIGLFQGVNTVLVGDATTGEIFYSYNADESFPIASTTKLMTYLLMEEAVQSGRISYDDLVEVSFVAEELSKTSDGLIPLKAGQQIPLRELIYAALIISSNECDHMVSEHFGGDEENIVAMMNDKAAQLSMKTAKFYNCNGLPIYSEELIPAKMQNRMSSRDMFIMASYILNNYPQVKEITSTQYMKLEVLDKDLKNTNPLLFNMPEVNGLKTGTTNRSGACLVASLSVNDGNMDHDIVVVEFGAETSTDRGRITEMMARYGKSVVLGEAQRYEEGSVKEEGELLTANSIVNMIVNNAIQNKGK